jgi:branched-chain amino acid transport system ATP-binding protein
MNLKIEGLNGGYGEVQVLWDVNLEIKEGEIVTLIGSNGAGKTTTLKTIVGLLRPFSASIRFNGENLAKLDVPERLKKGICLIPEGRQLFSELTVIENLQMGAFLREDKNKIADDLKYIFSVLPRLKERSYQIAETLSGGEQQMCAVARGLMSAAKILLVDELSLGLAPIIVDELVDILRKFNQDRGLSILLVEQDVEVALGLASRGYVMETGHIVIAGKKSEELLADNFIREAYLGI